MPKIVTEPLEKVTLNLFEKDLKVIRSHYGQGWSERVREVVHEHVLTIKPRQRLTIGDIIDDD